MSQTTLTVREDTLKHFNRLKAELNDKQDGPDHNANTFLLALLDTWEAADDGYYDNDVDAEAIANELKDEIDSLAFQGAMFDGEAQELIEKIDGLEGKVKDMRTQLPIEVANEVQR